ncbi:MAG: beta-galactosidase trimerization domain-containing protein [Bacillota bacterium]
MLREYAGWAIAFPALYAAPDEALERLNVFVKNGGHVVYSFKSGFADEVVKVRTTHQPGIINEACGIYYSMFVEPKDVRLKDDPFGVGEKANTIETWMELITPTTAEVLAYYDHSYWGKYASVTRNSYGKGIATYVGCMTSAAIINRILQGAVQEAGLWGKNQELTFPVIVKKQESTMPAERFATISITPVIPFTSVTHIHQAKNCCRITPSSMVKRLRSNHGGSVVNWFEKFDLSEAEDIQLIDGYYSTFDTIEDFYRNEAAKAVFLKYFGQFTNSPFFEMTMGVMSIEKMSQLTFYNIPPELLAVINKELNVIPKLK